MVGGLLSGVAEVGVNVAAVSAVVAGVTMVTVAGDPEVSTAVVAAVEDEKVRTVVVDIDRGQ